MGSEGNRVRITQRCSTFRNLKRVRERIQQKRSWSQECKVRGWEIWTILHHTPSPLPPNEKKRKQKTKTQRPHNRFYIKPFIVTKDRVMGSQAAEAVRARGRSSKWMHRKREKSEKLRNIAQYLPAEKGMRCSHVNGEGARNARYGGVCLAPKPPFPVAC